MNLLICAQAVDADDPALSFFIGWIRELSKHYQNIHVICLKEGRYELPQNVRVHSLGKETAKGSRLWKRIRYVLRLRRFLKELSSSYDAVFVHQNQEYILVAGDIWKRQNKPVYFWRNHYEGNFLTNIALNRCKKIFYTSNYSYTAKFPRAQQMPVGIDTDIFSPDPGVVRSRSSVVFLARIAPSKRTHLLLEALGILYSAQVPYQASIYGASLPEDHTYHERLKERVHAAGIAQFVHFYDGVPHTEVAGIFRKNDIFVNLAKSGMLDKTIFEAAASGCVVLVASHDLKDQLDPRCFVEGDSGDDIARALRALLELTESERLDVAEKFRKYVVEEHGLKKLGSLLSREMA